MGYRRSQHIAIARHRTPDPPPVQFPGLSLAALRQRLEAAEADGLGAVAQALRAELARRLGRKP